MIAADVAIKSNNWLVHRFGCKQLEQRSGDVRPTNSRRVDSMDAREFDETIGMWNWWNIIQLKC